ncbi:MAG: hypothetical protein ABR915_21040, partial [Thermoguttaceae bacterium]
AITEQPDRAAAGAFAAAILGENRRQGEPGLAAAILRARAAGVPADELLDAIQFVGIPSACQTDTLHEAGFNPDEPRDERGRWTAGATASDSPGSAPEQKSPSEASPRARELDRILPSFLDKLKDAAKHTKQVERFGVILKSKDPKAEQPYKSYECVTKKSWEKVQGQFGEELFGATNSPYKWWGSDKMHGGVVPKPGPDGKIDLDAKGKADPNDRIEFDWHTHPQDGDPWPSGGDGAECKKNDVPGVMLRYFDRKPDGKTEDHYSVWIIDTDGKTYEYKPKAPPRE